MRFLKLIYPFLDYVFTHKGKSLSEIQRYERGEEDDSNELDGDVVALANFGGKGLDVKLTDEEGNTRTFSRYFIYNVKYILTIFVSERMSLMKLFQTAKMQNILDKWQKMILHLQQKIMMKGLNY